MCDWVILIVSMTVFVLAAIWAIYLTLHPYRQKAMLKPIYVLTCGVFAADTILFLTLNYPTLEGTAFRGLTTFLTSVHTSIRLFLVDCDFGSILSQTTRLTPVLRNIYIIYSAVLCVICPILTASTVLSFFANVSAYNKYICSYHKDAYIFSELNERSLALARSFKENGRNRVVVFTDVFKDDGEKSFELIERAKKLDAILFKNDITVVNFRFHSKKRKLYFFIIGDDEVENIKQITVLASPPKSSKSHTHRHAERGYDYADNRDVRIFFFTVNFSSEQLLSAVQPKHIKVRRVNDVQALIYNLLYNKGMDIFTSARPTGETVHNRATGQEDPQKKISAMVLGLGLHGTEMIKALSWFCQMHPYSLEINAFDRSLNADKLFMSGYPDLFDRNLAPNIEGKEDGQQQDDGKNKKIYHNGDITTPGEAHYKISIYPGQDVSLYTFDKMLEQMADTTYIFVALGNDDLNLNISTKLRILFRRMGCNPIIHTVVYSPAKMTTGNKYDIFTYGDVNSNYSEACLLHSELEELALERHMKYARSVVANSADMSEEEKQAYLAEAEESFWKVDYNYRSSVASALHSKFKKALGIPGADKAPGDRTEDEKWFYRIMEHQRWNAYVRSEGYVYAPVRDKLAKTHHLLVPFEELELSEKIKDDD